MGAIPIRDTTEPVNTLTAWQEAMASRYGSIVQSHLHHMNCPKGEETTKAVTQLRRSFGKPGKDLDIFIGDEAFEGVSGGLMQGYNSIMYVDPRPTSSYE